MHILPQPNNCSYETQKGYAQAGNAMSFRLLRQLYDGSNLICSPLSLQYALAMTANGASGETLQEIIDFLGYGAEGIDALNAYCKTLLDQLQTISWADIENGLTTDAKVNVRLPKFDIENKFNLIEPLKELGIKRAFNRDAAELGCMFEPKEEAYQYWIGQVIQKARVTVAEWGVKAAAVTVVGVVGATAPEPEPIIKEVNFYADHPFAYFIAESTSNTILFEGVYTGR